MSKTPYFYILPEQFIRDQAVPARWRVWAVVNGFLVNGQKCWASNEWIGEKIGAHKDTVSQAVKELETLNVIKCERTRRSRLIGPVDVEIGTDTYHTEAPTPISDSAQRLSISISNSESKKAAKAAFPSFSVHSDTQRAQKDPAPLKLREKLYDMFSKEYGVRPSPNWGDYKRVEAALKHLTEKQVIDLVEDALEGGKPPLTVRQALTDRAIDSYRYDHA